MTLEEKISTLSLMCGMSMALNYTFKSQLAKHEISCEWSDEMIYKLDQMVKDLFYPESDIEKDKR